MQITKTQTYDYQLSKDNHYHNIVTTKPAVHTHIDPATARTIKSHSRPHNRDIPYLQSQQIDEDNQLITKRILNIFDRGQTQIHSEGKYARYNHFEQSFRGRNPGRDRKQREIQLQNEQLCNKLNQIKPRIGSLSEWQVHHKNTSKYSQIKSRHSHSKNDSHTLSLFHSDLPDDLLQLEANLRKIRNKPNSDILIHSSRKTQLPDINRPKHL